MEFNISVPTQFNDKSPVPEYYFEQFESFLDEQFGAWTKRNESGGWLSPNTGIRYRDPTIKYSIFQEDFSPELLDAIANVVGTFWNQEAVYYDIRPTEGHIYEPEKEPEQEEGRWDKPPMADPNRERIIKEWLSMADQTGDLILQMVDEGTASSIEADTLIGIQAQVKEAVLNQDFDFARKMLIEMRELVDQIISRAEAKSSNTL